ncbi:MAG: hypothetical protein ACR2QC_10325 [Gammaproteobacteria bacterium]
MSLRTIPNSAVSENIKYRHSGESLSSRTRGPESLSPQGESAAAAAQKFILHSAKKKVALWGIFVYNSKSVRRGVILSIKEHLYEKLHFYDSPPVRGGFWRD